MASKSSTLLNGPYDLRIRKIFCDVAGPMPGTCCCSSALAVLALTGFAGAFFLPALAVAHSAREKNCKNRNAPGDHVDA